MYGYGNRLFYNTTFWGVRQVKRVIFLDSFHRKEGRFSFTISLQINILRFVDYPHNLLYNCGNLG